MADFAIGGSIHKTNRTLLRAVPLVLPNRYFAVRDPVTALITLPTLATGQSYIELQGVTKASFKIDDNEQEFRLFGDDGWSDSVTTGSKVSASFETFFMKDIELPAGVTVPEFRGNYSEDFALIERCRYDKDTEVYVEILKEMGRASGATGNFIYDFAGFNAVFRNYSDGGSAEGLSGITFDAMSRGRPVFGRYDAGSTALSIGQIQSTQLATFNATLSTGTRRFAVVPVDNASGVVVSTTQTVTYTTDGSTPLTQLLLNVAGGGGFRLENASSGVQIPANVALATNVVTITPVSNLPAATIVRLRVADGAITQSLDSSGNPSASGIRRPMQGFTTTFRTA